MKNLLFIVCISLAPLFAAAELAGTFDGLGEPAEPALVGTFDGLGGPALAGTFDGLSNPTG